MRELAGRSVGTKPGLHARLAMLAEEPTRAAELAANRPACRPEELLTIRDTLEPHAKELAAIDAELAAAAQAQVAALKGQGFRFGSSLRRRGWRWGRTGS